MRGRRDRYRALFGPDRPLKVPDGRGPRRLRLRLCDSTAAALPWHCLSTPGGQRLGAAGWIIEPVGPEPRPAAVRTLHRPLILAPGADPRPTARRQPQADLTSAPEVQAQVDRVSAALAPLLLHSRCHIPWAVDRLDLARELRVEPDLIYCYTRIDAAGGLVLGRDQGARESLSPAELIALLDAQLPEPPILWLHCVECSPLLLTGEPGTGKTQTAFYIARWFDLPEPCHFQVRSDSSARDLRYDFDAAWPTPATASAPCRTPSCAAASSAISNSPTTCSRTSWTPGTAPSPPRSIKTCATPRWRASPRSGRRPRTAAVSPRPPSSYCGATSWPPHSHSGSGRAIRPPRPSRPSNCHRNSRPHPLDQAARRTLVWGLRQYASERPSRRLDTTATVAASARAARPRLRFEPVRRLREVWLWRDLRLADPAPAALIGALDRGLVRAGLRVRHWTFSALPDPLWPDAAPDAPEGRPRDGGTPAHPADLATEAREALVAVFTDGRGLAAALHAGGERAARARGALRTLGAWPRACLVDCAGESLDLPGLVRGLGLPRGQTPECIAPADLPAWLAERRGHGRAPARPPAVATADAVLWAACTALPALPVTAAQGRALHRHLGLPADWRPPAETPGTGRPGGAAAPCFTPAERHSLLRELAARAAPTRPANADPGADLGAELGAELGAARQRLARALDFWRRALDDLERARDDRGLAPDPAPGDDRPRPWNPGPAAHRLAIERALLDLRCPPAELGPDGRPRLAPAVKALWDRWCFYTQPPRAPGLSRRDRAAIQADLDRARGDLTARLAELSALDLGDADDGRIHLPWETAAIREVADEPPGTTLARLFRMGFAGAAPHRQRPRPGFEVRLALGLLAGAAPGALTVLAFPRPPPPGALSERFVQRVEPDALAVFRDQIHLIREGIRDGTRVFAASRKVAASADLADGRPAELLWCWTGAAPVGDGPEARACRALWDRPDDPRRLTLTPIGDPDPARRTALLRAGTLAEPIRACTRAPDPPWPGLSVAVIAAGPWRDPRVPDADADARRLAIRLLDSGAVDLAIVGPDWAAAARRLAADWASVPDGQWLFFTPWERGRPARQPPELPLPAGSFPHQALIQADYARLALHLRDQVQGVLDPADARERPDPAVARISTLTGNPRLWGGPERETPRLKDGTPLDLVRVCPGTFTMGADGFVDRRLPQIVAATLGRDPADLTDDTPLDAAALGGEAARERLRGALNAGLGTAVGGDDWKAVSDLRTARERFGPWLVFGYEDPAHPVLITAFNMARTETTVTQDTALGTAKASGTSGQLPLASIDAEQAARVCAALPTAAGREGSLPTEAQWEYAARGGSRTAWSWGDDPTAAGDFAWYSGNSGPETHPIGGKWPNPFGLVDLHGNLSEWVRDCYADDTYQSRAGRLLVDPLADREGCRPRVLRGGSSWLAPWGLRSAGRGGFVPGIRRELVGFRCVSSVPRNLVP